MEQKPPPGPMLREDELRVEQIPYQVTLAVAGAAGSGVRRIEEASFDGNIKEISIHWPGGCNALVDVAVWHNTFQLCPREGFLALNNATPTYKFNRMVRKADNIIVVFQNGDAVNAHTITVTVTIEERR